MSILPSREAAPAMLPATAAAPAAPAVVVRRESPAWGASGMMGDDGIVIIYHLAMTNITMERSTIFNR